MYSDCELFDECIDKNHNRSHNVLMSCYDEHKIRLSEYNLNLVNFTVSMNIIIYDAEHNRLDFGALLKSIIGNFKSIIGSRLIIVEGL